MENAGGIEKLGGSMKRRGNRHIYIPDTQVRKGVPIDHLKACGNYIAEKRPHVVICGGDFADMPSLGTHKPKGHGDYENARYMNDIVAVHNGMRNLMLPFVGIKGYNPKLVLTLGNHEDRITRTIKADPVLQGKLSLDDLNYKYWGWQVVPFLRPIKINGILYSHYFVTGIMDRPICRASQLITKYHQSCIAGHQQGRDIAYGKYADGRPITSIIAGSFYQHKESYLSPQSNNHWRGIYMLNEVHDGSFDEMPVSLGFLKERYL